MDEYLSKKRFRPAGAMPEGEGDEEGVAAPPSPLESFPELVHMAEAEREAAESYLMPAEGGGEAGAAQGGQ